jgi:predicted nucleic acid-binding protein
MAMFYGLLDSRQVASTLRRIMLLNVYSIPPSDTLHRAALEWAERLGQARAYDAQYLALAEQSSAELWTADEKLYNRARQLGISWVHWVGEQ